MDIQVLLTAANIAGMTGWIALLVALVARPARPAAFVYAGLLLPIALAVFYTGAIGMGLAGPGVDTAGMTLTQTIRARLSSDLATTAAWVHYLCFDLFIGAWICRDGLARGAWRLLLAPILLVTFLFGPVGLLAYVVLWAAVLRRRDGSLPAPSLGASAVAKS